MLKRNFFIAIPLVAMTTLAAIPAEAETIAITDGFVTTYLGDLGGFSFTGPGFSAGGAAAATLPTSLVPGSTVFFNGSAGLSNLGGGFMKRDGTTVSSPQPISGRISWTTVALVVPQPEPGMMSGYNFTAPFTATGLLTGFADLARQTPVLSVDLTGQGLVVAGPFRVVDISGTPTFINPGPATGTVRFLATSPTPEPASLLLLGGGLAAALFRRRTLADRREP